MHKYLFCIVAKFLLALEGLEIVFFVSIYYRLFRLNGCSKPELATNNDGRNFVDLLPMESIHAIRVMLPRNTEGRAQA